MLVSVHDSALLLEKTWFELRENLGQKLLEISAFAMPRLPTVFARHQPTVDLFTQYCTTHQNLIWGVSMVSGITVGWMSYASRKYHHKKIENKFDSVTKRLSEMEKREVTRKYFYRIAMPLCVSCLCVGYGFGRLHSSWRSYKHWELWKGEFITNIDRQLQNNTKITNYPMISDIIKGMKQGESESSTSTSYNPANWMKK